MRCTYYSLLVFALIFAVCGPLYAAQEETVETKIKTMLFDPTTDAPVVVLETVGDKKLVPIWIDIPEARAIALELQHVQPPAPSPTILFATSSRAQAQLWSASPSRTFETAPISPFSISDSK